MKLTMKYIHTIILSFVCAVLSAQVAPAGLGVIDMDALHGKTKNSSSAVEWIDKEYFVYSPEEESGKAYYLVSTRNWKPCRMFENASLAEKLKDLAGLEVSPSEISIRDIKFLDEKMTRFSFSVKKQFFAYNMANGQLEKASEPEKKPRLSFPKDYTKSFSADSSCYVTAVGYDLWLYKGADSIRLSYDGRQWDSYSLNGRRELEPDRRSSVIGRWVGNSNKRLMIREDWTEVGELTIVNSLAKPRPEARTYKFPMPGDTGVVKYNVMLADGDSGKLHRIDMDRFKDQIIKLPILRNFPCTDRYAYLLRISRTCDTLDLCRVDVTDRSVKTLISEECKPHYNEQLFTYHVINDGKEILWWSEQTGKGRWYLYDGEGRLKNALTNEDFVSGNIVKIDTLARKVIFEGYGKEEGVNPHYKFYYEASFDGKTPARLLTPGNGTHSIKFSPGGMYIEDTWSRMDSAPQRQIVDRKGKVRFVMAGADVSALEEMGWRYPEVISLKAADGKTDLYGVVYTPLNMDPDKKYPIISSVYPGPQDDQVPQGFYLDENDNQSLANRGFVVINFAYRGSGPLRGREFHSYGYGNLRDYPLEDDYAVVRQIAERYPYADSTRVGIYGHSGGGFMTVAAMLERPDFYKVGVAASGNHDNNIYRQQWAETFHGVQNEGGCFKCQVPTNMEKAANLKGKLMLITGDVDDNVHPAGTYRMVDALIKANKRFDMMVFPGKDHAMGGAYYVNLIHDYFTDHLK